MNVLLDNLFFLGQLASLAGLGWGAWVVLREYLIDTVCPAGRGRAGTGAALAGCLLLPWFRRMARV